MKLSGGWSAFRTSAEPSPFAPPPKLPVNAVFESAVSVFCDKETLPPHSNFWRDLIETPEANLYAALGVHPHEAKHYNDEIEEAIVSALQHPRAVAWGEMGLDYHYNLSPPEVQRQVFERQLRMAMKLEKPMIIHTREAEDDTFEIMTKVVPQDYGRKIHVHCFTSSISLARRLLAHYPDVVFFGFTGVITFKNAEDIRQTVAEVPLNRILLETDGPFMAPVPYRGKVAHPGHIPYVAQTIADVKKVSLEEVLETCRANTQTVYGI